MSSDLPHRNNLPPEKVRERATTALAMMTAAVANPDVDVTEFGADLHAYLHSPAEDPESGWTWLCTLLIDTGELHVTNGPGGMTREDAHNVILRELTAIPGGAGLVQTWRRGAKDDTVFAKTNFGTATWAILPHDGDVREAIIEWLDDFAAPSRAQGLQITYRLH